MKKLIMLLLAAVLLVFQGGCWDRVELNDIALVSATALDLVGEKEYRAAVLTPLPSQMGGGASEGGGGGTSGDQSFYIDSSTGYSLRSASKKLQQRMSRKISYGHRRVVIIGSELAKEGINAPLDYLTRTRDTRLSTLILVARGEAINVLNANPYLEQLSSEAVRELAVEEYWLSIRDILYDLQIEGKDALIPIMDVVKNENNNPETQEEQVESSVVGLFRDDKLIYITSEEETEGVLWVLGEFSGSEFVIPVNDKEEVVVIIREEDATIKQEIKNNLPTFTISIENIAAIVESTANLNLEEPDVMQELEEKMNEKIKLQIEALIAKNLDHRIDTFGFGRLISQKEPKLWKEWKDDWREMLQDIEVEIEVSSQIESPGLFDWKW